MRKECFPVNYNTVEYRRIVIFANTDVNHNISCEIPIPLWKFDWLSKIPNICSKKWIAEELNSWFVWLFCKYSGHSASLLNNSYV